MSNIKILQATYASVNTGKDVTTKCQELINSGKQIPVNNVTFGDPDVGYLKYFTILYVIDNGLLNGKAKGCQEGDLLNLA